MHHHHHTGHRILWAMPPISWRMSTASSSLFMNEIRIKWHLNEKSKKVTFLTLNYCKLLYVHSSCLTIIITLFLSLISLNVLISSVMYICIWQEKNFLLVMLFRLYSRGYKNRATAAKKLQGLVIFYSGLEFRLFVFFPFIGHRAYLVCIQSGCFSKLSHSSCHRKPWLNTFFWGEIFVRKRLVTTLLEVLKNFFWLLLKWINPSKRRKY
jgi:hypothetical protein